MSSTTPSIGPFFKQANPIDYRERPMLEIKINIPNRTPSMLQSDSFLLAAYDVRALLQ